MQRRFSWVALAVVVVIALTTAASADTVVSYATSGLFGGTGSSGNTIKLGGITVTFTGVGDPGTTSGVPLTLLPGSGSLSQYDWSYLSLGTFRTAQTGTGGATFNGSETFDINIYQYVPATPDSAVASGVLKGRMVVSGSTLKLTFGTPTFTWSANGALYTEALPPLADITWGVWNTTTISPPSQNQGRTTLQGLAFTEVPEPGSMGLLSGGIAGLAVLIRRRRKS